MKLTVRQLKNLIKESVKQTLLEYSEDLEMHIRGKLENAKMGELVKWKEFSPEYTIDQIKEEIETNAAFQEYGPLEAKVEDDGVRKVEPRY